MPDASSASSLNCRCLGVGSRCTDNSPVTWKNRQFRTGSALSRKSSSRTATATVKRCTVPKSRVLHDNVLAADRILGRRTLQVEEVGHGVPECLFCDGDTSCQESGDARAFIDINIPS